MSDAAFALSTGLDVLRTMLAANIPVKLESKPGAGKTSHINALFDATNGYLETMVAVNHDPTDFGGIPAPAGDKYRLLPGEWAVDLVEAEQSGNYPITGLFLDEINTGGRAVLAALLKVVDERLVGFYRLPQSIRIIMAMNPAEANGGVDLTPAMANRVAHLPFDFPLASWATSIATASGFPAPQPIVLLDAAALDDMASSYAAKVGEYATSGAITQAKFEEYPEEANLRSGPYPTRRTWTLAARAMAAAEMLGFTGRVQQASVASLVGRKSAELFEDYLDTKSGINPADMLANPTEFPIPAEDDKLFTALDRMVNLALNQWSPGENTSKVSGHSVDAAATLLRRVGKTRPGVAASGIRLIALFVKENREFLSAEVTEAIREFKPVIEAAGGMM